jgi:dihydropteroate synthase
MGILNVTPDSFSDGGVFLSPDDAVGRARDLLQAGADIIDIGAESTRPGSGRVPAGDQLARLREIVPAVVETGALVSIDTTRANVAEFALNAGAGIVNDVSAGRDDPDILTLTAERQAGLCLMHMLGQPATMQADPHYDDVVTQVKAFLLERVQAAESAGVEPQRLVIDPGIGFGKRLEHNLALLAGTGDLVTAGLPVLIGPSRKRFIGELSGVDDPQDRGPGTIGACLAARARGAHIFRVHDVAAFCQALTVFEAVSATHT